MILIGISGGIGHGKTTFARYLAACTPHTAHYETSELINEIANKHREKSPLHPHPSDIAAINNWLKPLPEILVERLHAQTSFENLSLSNEKIREHPEYYKKLFTYLDIIQKSPDQQQIPITTTNKQDFRSIQQWLGGYLVAVIGHTVWYDELIRRAHANPELTLVTIGGVRYPSDAKALHQASGYVISIVRPDVKIREPADLTERERSLIQPDSVVTNNGSLEQLQRCAAQIFSELSNEKKLQASYQAVTF